MGSAWLNLGQILKINAQKYADKTALKDKSRCFSFAQINKRVNKLANGLLSLGLKKGDKVSVFLENCIEIIEIYLACAKTGLVINPINFRLSSADVAYIADNSDAKVFITHDEFIPMIDSIRDKLLKVKDYFVVPINSEKETKHEKYKSYNQFLTEFNDTEPATLYSVKPEDTWVLLYTSGTTGKPKGVVRSHESYTAFYLINAVDFQFTENDICLNVMPLCHVNTTFFSFTFTYIGGAIYVHPARHFDPKDILGIVQREKITFISLIPTHYSIILSVPGKERALYNVSSVKKLLCSSAPARGEIKKQVMGCFKGVQLYEGYGSTEAGIVTVLKPEEQMTKLGSIGRESCGTDSVKILDEEGNEVPVGQVGELYSRGPMLFDEYYKLPEKTKASFSGEWFSAGDMAKKDKDGYYYIVDRKDNMIITGGEHAYPSEVEEVIACHEKVFDVAVIGVPDAKWGEKVMAIVVTKENEELSDREIIDFCRDKMAGYKKPKVVKFIKVSDIPRTASGKILHRELRKRFGKE